MGAVHATAIIDPQARLGTGARISGQAGVVRDVQPGLAVAGAPAMPVKEFFRLCAIWRRQVKTRGKGDE